MVVRPPLSGPEFPRERLATVLPFMQGLSSDSRNVIPGMGFAAFPGDAGDGRPWIADALKRGATALLWDPEGFEAPSGWPVPSLAIPGLAGLASRVAAHVYQDPSAHLQVIGVTGTNGKTSTTHWIAQALEAAGTPCGLIGTLGAGRLGAIRPTGYTTPGPVALQAQLADLGKQGARSVAMEVSSHALNLARVDGVHFDLAVFTNLTRDHLDFHGSMAAYGEAKAALFHARGLRRAVVNIDDPFGEALAARLLAADVPLLTCSQEGRVLPGAEAILATGSRFSPEATQFTYRCAQGEVAITSPLVGAFNLANLLGVLACLQLSGIPLDALPDLVARLTPPPGRVQRIGVPGGIQAVVDYAHTPDALEQVLRALRAATGGGRLICVFGCGGDRDPGKRPLMGALAERLADAVILTSDNPRSEDPARILADIAAGMQQPPLAIEVDRAAAIRQAIGYARPGDLVLIAGKGHETTQESAGVKTPFSDLSQARAALGLPEGST